MKSTLLFPFLSVIVGLALTSFVRAETSEETDPQQASSSSVTPAQPEQAAAGDPDAPSAVVAKKPPLVRVTLNGSVQTSNPDLGVTNRTIVLYNKLSSSDGAVAAQAQADQTAGFSYYTALVSSDPTSPQTNVQFNAFLAQQKGVTTGARDIFINSAGNRGDENYGDGGIRFPSLEKDFQGYKLADHLAGKCRDQAEIMGTWMKSLGCLDIATTAGNWGGQSHVIVSCRDPDTNQLLYANYYNNTTPPSPTMRTATLQEWRQNSVVSPGIIQETGSTTSHIEQFEMQDPRWAHMMRQDENIAVGADQPMINVEIGNLDSHVSIQKMVYDGKLFKIDLFGNVGANRDEGDYFYHGEAGAIARAHTQRNLTDKTHLDMSTKNIVGYYVVQDTAGPANDWNTPGTSRRNQGAYTDIIENIDVGHDTDGGKTVTAGIEGRGQENLENPFVKALTGSPYNKFKFYASVKTENGITIEGAQDRFIWVKKMNESGIALHDLDTSVAVTKEKTLNNGVHFSDKVTGYSLGEMADGNTAVRNTFKIDHTTASQWRFTGSVDAAKVFDASGNPYVRVPFYLSVKGQAGKQFAHGELVVDGRYNLTQEAISPFMEDILDNAGIERSKADVGVTWRFGKKK